MEHYWLGHLHVSTIQCITTHSPQSLDSPCPRAPKCLHFLILCCWQKWNTMQSHFLRTEISLHSLQIVIEKCKGVLWAAILLWKWKLCLLFFFTVFDFFRERGLGLCAPLKAQGVSRLQIFPFTQHPFRVHATLGVDSFSTSCRSCWISFPHILKTARMTSTHWPHQQFEVFSFLPHPDNT